MILFGVSVLRVVDSRLVCSGISLVILVGDFCYCVFGCCCSVFRLV